MHKLIFALLFVFTLSAYAKDSVIEIGLASNFSEISSSSSNPYGNYFREGIKLAIEHKKDELARKNIKIKLKEFDYGTSQLKVVSVAKEACKSQVSLVLGYVYSSHALLAAPIHQKCKLPLFSPSATANRLSNFDSYIHLGAFSNQLQGEVLADIAIKELKAKKALAIYAADCAYCTDLTKTFKTAFEKEKSTTISEIPTLSTDQNFKEIAKKAKKIKADIILVPNHELFSARIISALVEEGIKVPFLGGDGWGNHGEQFLKVLQNKKIEGFSLSHWFSEIPTKENKTFVSQYKASFKKSPNDTAVLSYDSMSIIIEAILSLDDFSRAGIDNALNKVRSFSGVTGNFDYTTKGAPRKSIVLLKAGKSQYKFLKIINPKASK